MRISHKKKVTVDNYKQWLTPWVAWLESKQDRGAVNVDSHVLKTYMDGRYLGGTFETYDRIGNQIVLFCNQYLVGNKMTLTKPLNFMRSHENVQMPDQTMKKLMGYTRSCVADLAAKPKTKLIQ